MSWPSLQGVRSLRPDALTSFSLPQGYLPPTKNGAEPKRPSRPINITPLARLSATVPNTIVVNWSSEFGRVSMAEAGRMEEPAVQSVGRGAWEAPSLWVSLLSLVLMGQRVGGGVQSRG